MINPKSASKMHGMSAILYQVKFILFFFFKVFQVKVLECNNVILETELHAVFFIVSFMMFSTKNIWVLPLIGIMVIYLPF